MFIPLSLALRGYDYLNNLPTLSSTVTNPPQSDSSHGNQDKLWRLTKPGMAEPRPFPGDCGPAGFSQPAARTARQWPSSATPHPPAQTASQALLLFCSILLHFVTMLKGKTVGFLPNSFSPPGRGYQPEATES